MEKTHSFRFTVVGAGLILFLSALTNSWGLGGLGPDPKKADSTFNNGKTTAKKAKRSALLSRLARVPMVDLKDGLYYPADRSTGCGVELMRDNKSLSKLIVTLYVKLKPQADCGDFVSRVFDIECGYSGKIPTCKRKDAGLTIFPITDHSFVLNHTGHNEVFSAYYSQRRKRFFCAAKCTNSTTNCGQSFDIWHIQGAGYPLEEAWSNLRNECRQQPIVGVNSTIDLSTPNHTICYGFTYATPANACRGSEE